MNHEKQLASALEDVRQKDIALVGTKAALDNVRLARSVGHGVEMVDALFQLARSMAKAEWGADTEIDDFSEPEVFIVTNGRKTKRF